MKNEVQKIREEVEKLILRGAYSSQVVMDTRCKEEAYNEVLAILDTMQEEPVTSIWHDSNKEQPKAGHSVAIWNGVDGTILNNCIKVNPNRKWAYMDDLLYKYKEPVSEELENAAFGYADACKYYGTEKLLCVEHFKAGANWQKEHLWKPADDDDLPEIDREVIAILNNGKVVFAHRPPEYWDGKNIATGKVTRYYPETYDKGGWNIPDVKYWLDCYLPKEIKEL